MSRTADIVALFSFRRISGQIAALIPGSLILIHVLIAGYFLLNRPMLLTDRPLEQFELIARIIANTSQVERSLVTESISRTFPGLKLQLKEGVSASTAPLPERTPLNIPTSLGGRADLIRGSAPEDNRVWFYLANDDVLEATIGSPMMPAFVSGLWTSTLLFLVASVTLLGVWAGRALSSPLSAFARAAEDFSLSRSSAPLPENGPEEIRSAARALNRMRDRITTLMNDRTRMLAAISHDLRTPITRLRLRSEYIEDPAQRTQTVRDLDQMQSMLESVLSLLRSETPVKPTLVDVAALLQMVCDQFSDSDSPSPIPDRTGPPSSCGPTRSSARSPTSSRTQRASEPGSRSRCWRPETGSSSTSPTTGRAFPRKGRPRCWSPSCAEKKPAPSTRGPDSVSAFRSRRRS